MDTEDSSMVLRQKVMISISIVRVAVISPDCRHSGHHQAHEEQIFRNNL